MASVPAALMRCCRLGTLNRKSVAPNIGDGLLDQISPELLDAFVARRGVAFDSYDEVRDYLKEMLARGDHSVTGVISQIKGQIGELVFRDEAGGQAYLAHATNQEAWDVAIPHAHGATDYIQVKIYSSVQHALAMMQEVQRKVLAGSVLDGGNTVNHIDFAVNEDIADQLREVAARHPELADVRIYSIPISDEAATQIVADGFANVGPEQITHLFEEWMGGTVSSAALHAMANAFLVYKGSKSFDAAAEDTLISTALSAPAIAAANGTSLLVTKLGLPLLASNPVIAAIAAGMLTRAVTKAWYRSRESMSQVVRREVEHNELLISALARAS